MRQRLLAEAALRAARRGDRQPLVVSLPAGLGPRHATGPPRFFAGLDQPWLQLVDLPSVRPPPGAGPPAAVPGSSTRRRSGSRRGAGANLGHRPASCDRAGGVYARLLDRRTTPSTTSSAGPAMLGIVVRRPRDADLARARTAEHATDYVRAQTGSGADRGARRS